LFTNKPLPGQTAECPPGEEVIPNRGEEFPVDAILASRTHYGKLQYQARWVGWDPDPEWYPASDFKGATAKLRQYHDENPGQAGPPVRLQAWADEAENDLDPVDHPDDEKPVAAGKPLRQSIRRKKG
jgi:hypothetical protein